MPTQPSHSPRNDAQANKDAHHPNPSRNTFAAQAQAQQKDQSMAAESARRSAAEPHINPANVPFKQPGAKSHNG